MGTGALWEWEWGREHSETVAVMALSLAGDYTEKSLKCTNETGELYDM